MNLLPTFGLVTDIIVLDVDNYFIVCEVLNTECFHQRFHAYEVSRDPSPTFVFVKQVYLADHSMLGLYNTSCNFVVLKYHVAEKIASIYSDRH